MDFYQIWYRRSLADVINYADFLSIGSGVLILWGLKFACPHRNWRSEHCLNYRSDCDVWTTVQTVIAYPFILLFQHLVKMRTKMLTSITSVSRLCFYVTIDWYKLSQAESTLAVINVLNGWNLFTTLDTPLVKPKRAVGRKSRFLPQLGYSRLNIAITFVI